MGRIVISDILRGIKSVDEVNLSLVDDEEKNILECVSIQMCGWFSGMCAHVCVCVSKGEDRFSSTFFESLLVGPKN